MALYHSPRIITNGLVAYLDAANSKSALNSVEVLVVGGGGGGGTGGGGGGGGGVLYSSAYSVTPGTAITVTVGDGGTNTSTWGANGGAGGNSVFGTLTAIGGGAGGHRYSSSTQGTGGSGGGNAGGTSGSGTVTMANGTSGQGYTGGSSIVNGSTQEEPGGGGGGAGAAGANSTAPVDTTAAAARSAAAGAGGIGVAYDISGTLTYYGGGGGGSNRNGVGASGGLGGGGAGGASPVAGTNGLGGGGGGTGYSGYGGGGTSAIGGSGVVIVRYPGPQRATGGTITSANNYTIHTFSSVGTTSFTPNTWYDLSGNNYSGTLTNGPTFTAQSGGYFSFDYTDDYVTTTGMQNYSYANGITVIFWHYNGGGTGLYRGVVTNGTVADRLGGFDFRYGREDYFGGGNNGTKLNWTITNTSGTTTQLAMFSNVNEWHCYAGTYDNTTLRVFKDGNLFDSVAHSAGGQLKTMSDSTTIGRSPGTSEYLDGRLANVSIYNRVLSANEIRQAFQTIRGRFGI